MKTATKYLFGNDLRAGRNDTGRDGGGNPSGAREPGAEPVSPQQQLAERLAYDRGLDEGRRVAEAAAERRLHETVERLATQMTGAIGQGDARGDAVEQQGLVFFDTLARKIAGRAIERYPLGPVEELAAEAFRHLRGVPHVAVRVPPDLVEDVDRLLGGMARERGFEGRIIVLGDDTMTASDARIEWADGGLVREAGALDDAVRRVLASLPPAEPPA